MVNNSLVKKDENKEDKTFSGYLMKDAVRKKINETIGGKNGQRFMTSILSAVSTNPALQECTHDSIISAAFLGEALGLSPSPQLGQYYMVPFNKKLKLPNGEEKNIKVAQFQIGYKGYIQLAIRSGYYKKINVLAIKEGELVKYDPLTEEIEVNLIEDDEVREQTPTIGYYAMFEYLNGFRKTIYWSKKKMLVHADTYSQAFSIKATSGKYPKVSFEDFEAGKVPEKDMWKYSSFWYKDFDGMAYKTMLRQLISKWGIMSIDLQKAMEKDMAEIKENEEYEYIENEGDIIPDTNEIEVPVIQDKKTTNNISKEKKEAKNEFQNNIPDEIETDPDDFSTDEFFS